MPVRLRGELAIAPAGTLHPAGVMSTSDTAVWLFSSPFFLARETLRGAPDISHLTLAPLHQRSVRGPNGNRLAYSCSTHVSAPRCRFLQVSREALSTSILGRKAAKISGNTRADVYAS